MWGVTAKSWEADEDALKTLVRVFLASSVTYGFNYLRLTRSKKDALERLNRAAIRVLTGLLKFVLSEHLANQAQMNALEDIAE